jgi:hypothetical protein
MKLLIALLALNFADNTITLRETHLQDATVRYTQAYEYSRRERTTINVKLTEACNREAWQCVQRAAYGEPTFKQKYFDNYQLSR